MKSTKVPSLTGNAVVFVSFPIKWEITDSRSEMTIMVKLTAEQAEILNKKAAEHFDALCLLVLSANRIVAEEAFVLRRANFDKGYKGGYLGAILVSSSSPSRKVALRLKILYTEIKSYVEKNSVCFATRRRRCYRKKD